MKNLFISLFILSSFYAHACEQTKEHFILVHGVAGHAGHFGSLAETLESHHECAQAHHFEYETSNSELRVSDFARQLYEFLDTLPKGLNTKDLNLIGHSQGGLISLEWILQNYRTRSEKTDRLHRLITLSTPFWGSDFAAMGSSLFFPFGLKNNVIAPAGRSQLEDMKYGSFQSFVTLNRVLGARDYIRENIEVLNVAAMAPLPMSWLKDNS